MSLSVIGQLNIKPSDNFYASQIHLKQSFLFNYKGFKEISTPIKQ